MGLTTSRVEAEGNSNVFWSWPPLPCRPPRLRIRRRCRCPVLSVLVRERNRQISAGFDDCGCCDLGFGLTSPVNDLENAIVSQSDPDLNYSSTVMIYLWKLTLIYSLLLPVEHRPFVCHQSSPLRVRFVSAAWPDPSPPEIAYFLNYSFLLFFRASVNCKSSELRPLLAPVWFGVYIYFLHFSLINLFLE